MYKDVRFLDCTREVNFSCGSACYKRGSLDAHLQSVFCSSFCSAARVPVELSCIFSAKSSDM